MNSSQGQEILAKLRDRYDIEIDASGWESKQLQGGVALTDQALAALASAANTVGDAVAVVYEMESFDKEFDPVTLPLTQEGFHSLRQNLLSHFDLVMFPPSRKWAFVMTHDLEGILFGPRNFLSDFARGSRGSDASVQ